MTQVKINIPSCWQDPFCFLGGLFIFSHIFKLIKTDMCTWQQYCLPSWRNSPDILLIIVVDKGTKAGSAGEEATIHDANKSLNDF